MQNSGQTQKEEIWDEKWSLSNPRYKIHMLDLKLKNLILRHIPEVATVDFTLNLCKV